jgi:hypothetical protein
MRASSLTDCTGGMLASVCPRHGAARCLRLARSLLYCDGAGGDARTAARKSLL